MIPEATAINAKKSTTKPASWCLVFNLLKDMEPCTVSWGEVGALWAINGYDAQWTRRTAINKAISELAKYGVKVHIDGKNGLVIE